MKKKIIFAMVAAAVFLAFSCGKIKDTVTNPTNPAADPLENAAGGADNSTYPFESASDLAGFTLSGAGITGMEFSTEKAYMGSGSVKLAVAYTAPNMQGRLNRSGVLLSYITGKTISGNIWVPNAMFDVSKPYGGFIYIQFGSGNNNDWYQSAWHNLTASSGDIKGYWNFVTAMVDTDLKLQNGDGSAGHINGKTLAENGISLGTLPVTLGIVLGQGGVSANYSGYVYIDSINIQ